MLGQVLSGVLLGQPGTVQQLSLKQRQVSLQEDTARGRVNDRSVGCRQHWQET